MKKKIISLLLAVVMIAGMLPFGAISAFAESGLGRIVFMYYDESTNALRKGFFNGSYTKIENTTTSWNTGWYVAEGEVTIDTRVTVTGDVKLILKDGCKLTIDGGIRLADSNKLTVLGQLAGTGELNLTCDGIDKRSNAGIGGNVYESAGALTVCCCTVNAESDYAAGIGGGAGGGNGGTVTVYAGTVRASSWEYSAGIGGGSGYRYGNYEPIKGGTVTVYGGTVEASSRYECGIGGANGGSAALTINGGNVTVDRTGSGTAISVTGGMLTSNKTIGGKLTVSGGTVYAYNGDKVGIAIDGTVEVTGGTVTAETGEYDATCINGPVTVSGGTVNASPLNYRSKSINGDVNVSGGTLNFGNGANMSTGINGNLTADGGLVCFRGGSNSTGVAADTVTINGGSFYMTADFQPTYFAADNINVNSNVRLFDFEDGTYYERKEGQSWKDVLTGKKDIYSSDMFATILSFAALKSSENNAVPYLEYDAGTGSFTKQERESGDCQIMNRNTTSLSDGWYVVYGSKTIPGTVTVSGDVKLILADNCDITVNGSITVNKGNSLAVYAQSEGVNTGRITVNGDPFSAGIGGAGNCNGGNITINGGNVTANGGSNGAGIGGGNEGNGGNVTINGGTVSASGYNGIGCGSSGNNNGTLTIGENLFVYNKDTGNPISRIGGQPWADAVSCTNLLITDNEIRAVYIEDYSEIQYLEYVNGSFRSNTFNGEIYNVYSITNPYSLEYTLTDGWYIATGEAEISNRITVEGDVKLVLADGCDLKIPGGIEVPQGSSLTVYAQSDGKNMGILKAYGSYFGAGIGGSEGQNGGNITIHGGKIEATGGEAGGAGIGGGCCYIEYEFYEDWYNYDIYECGTAGEITIYGGDVSAQGGYEAAGIGGGYGCDGGTVNIYGGKVNAMGGGTSGYCYEDNADGIGCGWFDISPDNEPYPLDWSDIRASYPVGGGTIHVYEPAEVCSNEQKITPEHLHTLKKIEAKEATCTQTGISTEYYECIGEYGCGKYFADESAATELTAEQVKAYNISAKGHSFTNFDYETHKCTNCSIVENHIDSDEDDKCDVCGCVLCDHEHTEIIYNWNNNYTACTATNHCIDCTNDIFAENATEIKLVEDTHGANCQTMGKGHYEATFATLGTAKTASEFDTELGEHHYVDFVCEYCGDELIEDAKADAIKAIHTAADHSTDEVVNLLADNAEFAIDFAETVAEVLEIRDLTVSQIDAIKAINAAAGKNPSKTVKWLVDGAKEDICCAESVEDVVNIRIDCIAAIDTITGTTHTHTYSAEWNFDENYHWHSAACEHSDLVSGFAAHTFDEGVKDGNKTVYTCTECGYQKFVYDPAEDTEGEIVTGTTYTGISLTLGSDIAINFYMELSEEARQNGTMTFDIGGRVVTGVKAKYNETEKKYYFQTPLTALEMNETVIATFNYNGIDYIQEYSVADYIGEIIGHPETYGEKAVALAKKIANYGHYAQTYLESIHTNVTIGEDGYAAMNKFSDVDINVDEAKTALENYKVTVTGEPDNLSLYGSTVYFDSATALNYYVTVKDGVKPAATAVNNVTGKEKDVEIKLYKDNIYIVSVKDITATELADDIEVVINNEITLTGSVFAYCNAVMTKNGQTDAAKNAMAAFYEYYEAAVDYAETQD